MIYFTSDFHLSHANIITYCNRPFNNIIEMDQTIMRNFFERVKKRDQVYFLGDLSFNKDAVSIFFKTVRENEIAFHFIPGNHDKRILDIAKKYAIMESPLVKISLSGQEIILCHYAMRVWHKSHFNSWQLYGHSHGTLPGVGKQMDVGVDAHNFYPISFYEIKDYMDKQPDNFNYVKTRTQSKEIL